MSNRKIVSSSQICFSLLLLCGTMVVHTLSAQTPSIDWIRQFGTPSDDQGWEVATDSTGTYVAGITLGSLPGYTNAGSYDAFLRKYDFNGNLVWTRQFGTTSEDQARALAADATGVYVAGHTGGTLPGQVSSGGVDAYIRKYDSNGNEVWTRQFGTSSFESASGGVALDSSGVYVTGSTGGVFPGQSNAGQSAVFLRKYDFNGTELWTDQFGTPADDNATGIVADSTGVYVTGYTNGTLSSQSSAGGYDVFARKYDTSGNDLWTRQFGTAGTDLSKGLAIDTSGIYIPGHTDGTFSGQTASGGNDAFLRKYDLNGTELWTRQFGTGSADFAQGAAVDSTGVHVIGYVGGTLPSQTSSGGSDLFVRKYDPNGTEVHTLQFGTSGNDLGEDVAVHSTGLYLAGYTGGTFAGETSAGGNDAFVVKLDSAGPITSNVTTNSNPASVNESILLSATIDDSTTGNSDITSAEFEIRDGDGGVVLAGTGSGTCSDSQLPCPDDTEFDQVDEDVMVTIDPGDLAPGVYDACVRGTDSSGNVGEFECSFLVIYDPSAGFVTGGGWINSPVGAYTADPGLTGKASFGFVSKYLPGAHTPTGQTEFQFKAGGLNFHSSDYEWLVLVVAGARAQFKGTGSINGAGNYDFMVTAIDGALPGGGGADRFRIKITGPGGIVYDNQPGAGDNADPTTTLGGGNIVIHQ